MRYGVLGAGAIGAYIGARLAQAGGQVTLVGREGLRRAVEQAGGIELRSRRGEVKKLPLLSVSISTEVEALREASVVLVAVKSPSTEEAARALLPVLRPGAVVFSLQNGVQNPEILASVLGQERVAAGMVTFNVVPEGASFHQTTDGPVIVGRPALAPTRADALASDLRAASLDAEARADMPSVLWGKLLINLGNAIGALTDLPIASFLSDKDGRAIFAAAMREGLALLDRAKISPAKVGRRDPRLVQRLLSLPLPGPIAPLLISRVYGVTREARSSTWKDLSEGRKTEIDFLNGELVRLAASLGTQAPINEALVRLIKEAEEKGASPCIPPAQLRRLVGA